MMDRKRYEELVQRKNWFLQLTRMAEGSDFPMLSDPEMLRLLWAQCGDLERELAASQQAQEDEFAQVHWVSAASCYAKAGDVVRARECLEGLPAEVLVGDSELRKFFRKHGVT